MRYGAMKMIGEFPFKSDVTPGCGSRLVVRTFRGVEMGEMLTSTCPNSGCGSSVSRREMLDYIENSGGRLYPFSTDGRVLRVATGEDMDTQARLDQSRHGLKLDARAIAESMCLDMKIVEAEPILGGDRLTFYYTSDERVDFRELVKELSARHRARIDMRQVGSRDEARLTADYEKCGQYCCCKGFLKVLKPVNMRSAKVQKATLDPIKISGRCGRLMCCLRYEDESYEALAKRLPRRKARVGTPDGDGSVVSTQILTQLVLVRLDETNEDLAYPVEEIGSVGERKEASGPAREAREAKRSSRGRPRPAPAKEEKKTIVGKAPAPVGKAEAPSDAPGTGKKKRRRRRRKRGEDGGEGGAKGVAVSSAGDESGTRVSPAPESGSSEGGPGQRDAAA
ncbi:MAG: hypothetical protein K8E66_12520, partial [Phycisphaerales bacterium]|nr:hypothetical protein [Phycisphaerales bacterium]